MGEKVLQTIIRFLMNIFKVEQQFIIIQHSKHDLSDDELLQIQGYIYLYKWQQNAGLSDASVNVQYRPDYYVKEQISHIQPNSLPYCSILQLCISLHLRDKLQSGFFQFTQPQRWQKYLLHSSNIHISQQALTIFLLHQQYSSNFQRDNRLIEGIQSKHTYYAIEDLSLNELFYSQLLQVDQQLLSNFEKESTSNIIHPHSKIDEAISAYLKKEYPLKY